MSKKKKKKKKKIGIRRRVEFICYEGSRGVIIK